MIARFLDKLAISRDATFLEVGSEQQEEKYCCQQLQLSLFQQQVYAIINNNIPWSNESAPASYPSSIHAEVSHTILVWTPRDTFGSS